MFIRVKMKLYKAFLSDFSQEEYNKYYGMLDETRKEAVDRMRNEADKRLSVLGESLARRGISEHCKIGEAMIQLERTENGKPFTVGLDVCFSISHSKDVAVAAVSDKKIGVDIEKIRFCETRVARFACVESDIEYVFGSKSIPEAFDEVSLERFFHLWTAKEAYIKFNGKVMANIKDFSYESIKSNCRTIREGEYILTVYEENHGEKE